MGPSRLHFIFCYVDYRHSSFSLIDRHCLSLMLLLLSVMLVGSGLAGPLAVLESDSRHLSLNLEELSIDWREIELRDGAMLLFDPSAKRMITSGVPGGVRSPFSGGWLLVPPGTSPRIASREENWISAQNRPLMVQAIPVLTKDENADLVSMSELLVLPGEPIPADAPIPMKVRDELGTRFNGLSGSALKLGEIKWWRGHRIVSWRLSPIRHDGRLAAEALTSGSWDVVFEVDKLGPKALPQGHLAKSSNLNDERFSGFLLNQNILENLPTEAGYQGVSSLPDNKDLLEDGKSGTLLAPVEGRLGVKKTRLYRVTAERLRTLGFLPDQDVDERQIRLYQRRYLERLDDGSGEAPYVEIEVPIQMIGEDNVFDGDDFFIFYGLRLRDDVSFSADVGQGAEMISGSGDNHEMNNEVNFYWVAASEPDAGQSWARMNEQSIPAATGTPLANYRRFEHHEEQVGYRQKPSNITDDRLFLNHYSSTEVSVGFNPLWSPDPSGTPVNLIFQISGYSTNSPDLVLQLEMVTEDEDGNFFHTPLAPCFVDTNDFVEKSYTFSPDVLAGRSSKMVLDNGNTKLFSWLNWATLEYDALYRAHGNTLTFHGGESSGARPMVVTGFTTDDISLIEVTDPRNPVFHTLDGNNILADGDNWKLSLEAVQNDTTRHFVATGDFSATGIGEFNYYESGRAADQVSPLAVGVENPDLLVITHPEFSEAIERWVTHRQARSGGTLNIHVVEVQDIYDWYSGGLKDVWALKRLANHAISQWGTWALMLVGDANENVLELGVSSAGRGWSKDWVPTHFHVQATGYQANPPEVLASDKWFATFEAGMNYPVEDFPGNVSAPWQMYVGRFPCNSVAELNTMIDKVILVETPIEGQDWRKRMIFFADDHWSNGSGGDVGSLVKKPDERGFADVERDLMSPLWRSGSPVTLEADTLFLDNYLKPIWLAEGSIEPRDGVRYQNAITESNALTDLLTTLSAGALMAHYQGHANYRVLCSEYWLYDSNQPTERHDVQSLTNADSPWVFFGMGCHVSDWAQDTVKGYYPLDPSLGEKFLTHTGGGASATYGSSGFEYVDTNEIFGRYIMERWIDLPPNSSSTPDGTPTGAGRSRWMLGELLLCCEADVYHPPFNAGHRYQEMVAQFTLLGDPLMMLDAGPPVVTAVLTGEPDQDISGEVDIVSSESKNLVVINIDARDEAGISRLQAVDSTGDDLTSAIVTESLPDGETDHQQVYYSLDVPVRPFDHQIRIEVFDTGGDQAGDRHYNLVLNMAQEAVFTVAGEEVDPDAFKFGPDEQVDFQCELTSAAWLDDSMEINLLGENLLIENFEIAAAKSNGLSFSFTATAIVGRSQDRSVVLAINGFETTYVLESDGSALPDAAITRVLNYPNPMRSDTRFIYETSASTGEGKVRVFAVSGRAVATIPFTYTGGHEGIIEWDGQDNYGDNLANGTYLYRLEMNTPTGLLVSPMQRLVVMN